MATNYGNLMVTSYPPTGNCWGAVIMTIDELRALLKALGQDVSQFSDEEIKGMLDRQEELLIEAERQLCGDSEDNSHFCRMPTGQEWLDAMQKNRDYEAARKEHLR